MFNEGLEKCLWMLYKEADSFGASASLILRLAEMLNFDTFLDEDAYTHIVGEPLVDNNKERMKFKRLSIAGSLILLDIDILTDTKILRISLSLANHQGDAKVGNYYKIINSGDTSRIEVNFSQNNESFLGKSANPEKILLSSFADDKLGKFPRNLAYMADLDKSSGAGPDLFLYIDKLALVLKAIHEYEKERDATWELQNGYVGSVGRVALNNETDLLLGVFLHFWQDWRYINHHKAPESVTPAFGKNYYALLRVKPSTSLNEYLNDSLKWPLPDGSKLDLEFANNDTKVDENSSPWILCLEFNESIHLPLQIVELLEAVVADEGSTSSAAFTALNNHDSFHGNISLENGTFVDTRVVSDLPYRFIPAKVVEIKSLKVIPKLLSLARTFLFVQNLLVLFNEESYSCISSAATGLQNGGLNDDAKQKLIDTLQLPNDITDQELLGLNAVTDNSNFSHHMQPSENLDLESVMAEDAGESASIKKGLSVTFEEIDLTSLSLQITITGSIDDEGNTLEKQFSVLNGNAFLSQKGGDMEIDDAPMEKFVRALNVSEDIKRSFKYLLE